MALVGDYASLCIGFGLSFSNKWKKDPESRKYWKHNKSDLLVAQPNSYLLLVSNHDILSLLQAGNAPPDMDLPRDVRVSLEQKPCTLFFPDFGKEVLPEEIPINKKKLPVKGVLLQVDADKCSTFVEPQLYSGERWHVELICPAHR